MAKLAYSKREILLDAKRLLRDAIAEGRTEFQRDLDFLEGKRPSPTRIDGGKRVMLAEGKPGRWVVKIDRWHPTWLNKLLGTHWGKRKRLKGGDKEQVWCALWAHGVTRAVGKRRVGTHFVLAGQQKEPDRDNTWKSLLDAMSLRHGCGAIVDDSSKWVETERPTFERGDEGSTTITIEDIESGEGA